MGSYNFTEWKFWVAAGVRFSSCETTFHHGANDNQKYRAHALPCKKLRPTAEWFDSKIHSAASGQSPKIDFLVFYFQE